MKQEIEKQNEVVRSALRALLYVSRAAGALTLNPWAVKSCSSAKLTQYLQDLSQSQQWSATVKELATNVQ